MTEKSIMWTTGATGDGASEYTQAEVIRWLRQSFISDSTDEGILKNYGNELEVTGTSSPISVNTGGAYVYGFPYWSTASESVVIPTPSAQTRVDYIVLRAGWSAQTVRITRIAGTEGAGAPSLTQSDGVTWDVPLATASITTGGVITVSDQRVFLHPNIEIETAMIAADAITNAKIADDQIDSEHYVDGSIDTAHLANDAVDDTKVGNRVPQFYRRQGGSSTVWATQGSTGYTPTTLRMQGGVIEVTIDNGYNSGSTAVTFPTAFSYAPFVVVGLAGSGIPSAAIAPSATGHSTSGFTAGLSRDGSTGVVTMDVTWLAVGPE